MVFDGPEDYHARIDDPSLAIDENTMLFMRGVGPKGYPGAAEVVNMRAPDYLLKQGVTSLVCVGDGRQSGTSGSPSILNASPEAASGGGLALIETGDRVALDLDAGTLNLLVDERRARPPPRAAGGRGRLPLPGPPDPVAGNPARPRLRARDRRGAGAGGEVPAHRPDARASRGTIIEAEGASVTSPKSTEV